MGILNVDLLFSGQTGSSDQDQRTYAEVYGVDVSSPLDGQISVQNAVAIFKQKVVGVSYFRNGAEVDVEAKLKSVSAGRVEDTRLRWEVQLTYETPPKNNQQNENNEPQPDTNGNLSDEPNDWRERVEWGAQVFSKPLWEATLRTGAISKIRKINSIGPVVVASGEVVDPAPEIDDHDDVLRLTRFSREFPTTTALEYRNVVNNDSFEIRKPGLIIQVDRYEARLLPITGSLNYHTTKSGSVIPYYQVNYEIVFKWRRENQGGWRIAQLNHGYHRRAMPGDLVGANGSGLLVKEYNARKAAGMAAMQRITDAAGNPVGPVLLDYDGAPLEPGDTPLYLAYSGYREKAFSSLQIWRA